MAVTLRKPFSVKLGVVGPGGDQLRLFVYEVDFDSSYPTGGEPLDLTADITKVLAVFLEPKAGYTFTYDYTNKKILAYWGDNNNAADGPAVEVPDTTNLSTITAVRVLAIGY